MPCTWAHTFTPSTDLGTWGTVDGDYEEGVGWHSVLDPHHEIDLNWPTSGDLDPHITITRIAVTYDIPSGSPTMEECITVGVTGGGGVTINPCDDIVRSGVVVVDISGIHQTDVKQIFIDFFSENLPFTITEITIEGEGTDLFGVPCPQSDELTAIEELAENNIGAWFYLSPVSQAVLFWATPYWKKRQNWVNKNNSLDVVTNEDWDTLENYVDTLLYEAKNPMIGVIIPYVTAEPMPNVLPCDGATYSRVDYPNLYDVIDSFFIIDADNFKVPDLRGRTVIGAGEGSGLTSRSMGDTGGEEAHQLSEAELAAHSHTIPLTTTTLAVEPGEVVVLSPVPVFTANTGSTGADMAHENMSPFYALSYGIIAS